MRFKVDENLPVDVAVFLRDNGHEAHSILEEQLGGAIDAAVREICKKEARTLVTLDKAFGNIRAYPPSGHDGVIVLRLARSDTPNVLSVIKKLIPLFLTESISRRLWVVDEMRVRIHE